jgi:hypothetical protein
MKKFVMPVIAMLFQLCTISSSFADTFWRTYEVVAISDNSLTLVDSDGTQVEVNKDPKDYKVGYKVRYDDVRDVLKKDHWAGLYGSQGVQQQHNPGPQDRRYADPWIG